MTFPRFDVVYKTGLAADAELHAGGILFHVVYRACLKFTSDGFVEMWNEIAADSMVLDDEAEQLAKITSGSYHVSSRGYAMCEFPNRRMTAAAIEELPQSLVAHIYDFQGRCQANLVFSEVALGASAQ